MKKLLMIVLDGFGIREDDFGNAIKTSKMEFFNRIWDEYPHSKLEASGEAVGLPDGICGTSEVGHEIMGAGKKIKNKLAIVYEEIATKKVINNEQLIKLVEHVKKNNSVLHLMGLLSDGGVHSHNAYILKLIPILKEMGVTKIIFHVITDGRDTNQTASLKYIYQLEEVFKKEQIGIVGTICGRYYAMDRDRNYDRTEIYYNMVTGGKGINIKDLDAAIKSCYTKGVTDEYLPPLILKPNIQIREHDALLWLNYRMDRTTQIINSLTDPEFPGFNNPLIKDLKTAILFPQSDVKNVPNLFEKENDKVYPLGEYFSDLGFTQARIAESEKYSFVTTAFNYQKNKKFPGTENILIPSPNVSTFDKAPLMSAAEVTEQTIKALEKDYDFILVNYANPDMLGHTGSIPATVIALEALDKFLAKVITHAEDNFYKVIILSDHGNADTMIREDGSPDSNHSLEKVPFILMDKNIKLKETGDLTMVASTILKYLDIAIPDEMKESKNLIIENNDLK